MEEVVGLVAVADERVTNFAFSATVHHRMVGSQVLAQHRIPILCGEIALLGKAHVGIETEIVDECSARLCIIRTTFFRTILHVTGHTALVHQLGNSINLCLSAFGGQGVGHIGIIETGLGEVDFEESIFVSRIIVATSFLGGLPELDDLGHCRGNTTSPHMVAGSFRIYRTEGVIVLSLIPSGGNQRVDAFGQICSAARCLVHNGLGASAVIDGHLYLSSQVLEEPLDMGGQFDTAVGLDREISVEAVAQHLLRHIVGTDKDKRIVAHIDDVECSTIAARHHLCVDNRGRLDCGPLSCLMR